MLLKGVFAKSRVVLAVTSSRYDVSMFTYLRFMAKQYLFSALTVDRESRVKLFGVNSKISNILAGPVVLFYSEQAEYNLFLEKLMSLSEVEIVFLMIDNNILLSDFDKVKKESDNTKVSVVSSISPINYVCDLNHIFYNLIMLLDANQKSIVQRDSNS